VHPCSHTHIHTLTHTNTHRHRSRCGLHRTGHHWAIGGRQRLLVPMLLCSHTHTHTQTRTGTEAGVARTVLATIGQLAVVRGCLFQCSCAHTHIHTNMHTNTHKHSQCSCAHTHIHTNIHTNTQAQKQGWLVPYRPPLGSWRSSEAACSIAPVLTQTHTHTYTYTHTRTGTEAGVARTVLATIGQLAVVSGCSFRPYVADVLPLVIEAIQDAASPDKRIVAVKALGQVCLCACVYECVCVCVVSC